MTHRRERLLRRERRLPRKGYLQDALFAGNKVGLRGVTANVMDIRSFAALTTAANVMGIRSFAALTTAANVMDIRSFAALTKSGS